MQMAWTDAISRPDTLVLGPKKNDDVDVAEKNQRRRERRLSGRISTRISPTSEFMDEI